MSFKIHKLFACSSCDSRICLQSETILQKNLISSTGWPSAVGGSQVQVLLYILGAPPVHHPCGSISLCSVYISLWPRQYTTRQHSATQIRSSELLSPAKSLLSPARVQHMIVSTQIGACANIVSTPLRILSRLV